MLIAAGSRRRGRRASDAPRYSDAAGVENHPQVTDFVPRRYRTIAMFVLIGAGLTATMAALHYLRAADRRLDRHSEHGGLRFRRAWQPGRLVFRRRAARGQRDVPADVFDSPPPHRRFSRPLSRLARRDVRRAWC